MIFLVIVKKSSDSKFIFANGSRICASNPADIRIISGLNLSTGLSTLFSNICKNSLLLVPALKLHYIYFLHLSRLQIQFQEIKEIHGLSRKQLNYLLKIFLAFHCRDGHQNL